MAQIPWWFTELGDIEKQELVNAFDQRKLSMGTKTAEFEKLMAEAMNVPYVLATNTGTSALTMSMLALGVGVGDEVIAADLPWIATVQAAAILGADIKLVDTLPDTPLMDMDAVEKLITPKTKAIVPVHYNGRACDLDRLQQIADKHGIAIVEDACKAMMSKYKDGRYLGTIGKMGCFSLSMISPVSIGYGGAVATHDKELYEKLKCLRFHGVKDAYSDDYDYLSANFKVSDLMSAIGIGQMSWLDKKLEMLRSVYRRYREGLKEVDCLKLIEVDVDNGEIPLIIDVISEQRDKISAYLLENDVQTCNFHPTLHRAAYLKNTGTFPNASRFFDYGFILPSGPSQTEENIDKTVDLLKKWKP